MAWYNDIYKFPFTEIRLDALIMRNRICKCQKLSELLST